MALPIDPRLREAPFRGSLAVAEGLVPRNQLRSGRFVRLVRDVYVIADVPVTHELRCRAASLIIPASAALTGRSAATARGIPLAQTWDPVEVAVPENDRFVSARDLVVRRVVSSAVEQRRAGDSALTTPERMCFDLTIATKLEEAVADVDAVLHGGVIDAGSVERYLAGSHERGVRHACRVLALADGRAESRPESITRVVLVLDGLRPEPQLKVFDTRGRFVARVDLGFEDAKVAVEYEGIWHGEAQYVPRDRVRLNKLQAAGWHVVFVIAGHLHNDRRGVIDAVRTALRRAARPASAAS